MISHQYLSAKALLDISPLSDGCYLYFSKWCCSLFRQYIIHSLNQPWENVSQKYKLSLPQYFWTFSYGAFSRNKKFLFHGRLLYSFLFQKTKCLSHRMPAEGILYCKLILWWQLLSCWILPEMIFSFSSSIRVKYFGLPFSVILPSSCFHLTTCTHIRTSCCVWILYTK